MPRELKDIDISYVSLVDKAANKKKFLLMKNENSFTLETKAFINKSDEDKHLVYGIVYEPDTLDSDGDYATAESIEKAAHSFMMNHRNVDIQHNFEKREDIKIAESYIAPTDLIIGEQNIKKGTWLMVTKVEDEDIWKSAKEGNFTGFSMAGSATTIQKSVSGKTGLSVNETMSWDSSKAERQIWNYATKEDSSIDVSKAKNCFMWYDESKSDTKGAYKLPFVYIIDGSPTAIRSALIAVNNALEGARGGVTIPNGDKSKIRNKIKSYSNKMDNPIPAFVEKGLKESYEKNKVFDNIQQAFTTFKETVFKWNDTTYVYEVKTSVDENRRLIQEFFELVSDILLDNDIYKSEQKSSLKDKLLNIFKKEEKKEVHKMDEKQIQELISKSVGDAIAKSEADKKAELEKSEAKSKATEELNATIAKAVEGKLKEMGIEKAEESSEEIENKKIESLEKELAELKKARKTSNSLDSTVQKSENKNVPNYLKSFM